MATNPYIVPPPPHSWSGGRQFGAKAEAETACSTWTTAEVRRRKKGPEIRKESNVSGKAYQKFKDLHTKGPKQPHLEVWPRIRKETTGNQRIDSKLEENKVRIKGQGGNTEVWGHGWI